MTELMQKQLIFQRSIERALENFKKLGRANITAAKIRTRIAALKDNWTHYQHGHALLMSMVPAKERASVEYFTENQFETTEDIYQATWEYLTEFLEHLEPVVSPNQSLENNRPIADASSLSQSHMPKINLPPFDGTYADWESFRDRFSALIIKNNSLTDFARMHYLSSSLKGSALDSIGNISITADNFNLAWTTLTARFENKRRLIASHFSTLLGLPVVNKESASELQLLCDKYKIAVSSLENLGRTPSNLWNDFLVYSMIQKLDSVTKKAWTMKTNDVESPPSYEDLIRFLTSRIRALEECASPSVTKPPKSASASRVHVANASTTVSSACPLCKSRHYLSVCTKFTSQNPTQRRNTIKQFKRCFNCLSASHSVQDCKSQYSCRSCGKRHHTLLHVDSDSGSEIKKVPQDMPVADPAAQSVEVNALLASATLRSRPQVILATARVKFTTDTGRSAVARALLDQGSEVTFISETLSQTLRARRIRMPVAISAVGGAQVGTVRHATAITISPNDADTPSFTTTALIMPSLTSYAPKRSADLSVFEHLSNLKWADSDPTSSDPIHAIIGADLYSLALRKGIRKGTDDQPIAQNSAFGWIISGPIPSEIPPPRVSLNVSVHQCTSLFNLSQDIQKFWETEELPHKTHFSIEEEKCEAHFLATHYRNSDGRYTVRLPFKTTPPPDIGQSRHIAGRQFFALSRRLASQPVVANEYRNFMREYENLGHMCRVSDSDSSVPIVFIPHHPVFRADSSTTRLRVVFNASSSTSNGTSLNDHLLAGPKLQTDLPSVILLWRQYRFVYTADIAKMYRQILVDPRDRDYQRILWQPEHADTPCDYQLLTVTYGMTCAPFLALRVIKRLADEGHRFPLTVPILRDNIYVDDVLFGAHDIPSLRQHRDQLISILQCGRFELRKWASNSSTLLEDIDPSNHGLACSKSIAVDEQVKVLGISWNPARDSFQFQVSLERSCPNNKRKILSTIARLYDPLGWVTPVTVAAKIFMQRLWRSKVNWDDDIPEQLSSQWRTLYAELAFLNHVNLDRWTNTQPNARIELHGFADASTMAYAASVYIKVTSSDGEVTVSLLAGKSKVAPIAPLTIPRLELSAALLLTRLISFIRESLRLESTPCFCWTDSTIVLAWIQSNPSRWNTFVANRVLAIQTNLPDASWRHVPTLDNPADCASRGLHGNDLLIHPLWWHGPPWLKSSLENWPQAPSAPNRAPPEEKTTVSHHAATPNSTWELADRFSSWAKLIRVTAYIIRFVSACRTRSHNSNRFGSGPAMINSDDCSLAKKFWIKYIQANLFPVELHMLTTGHPIPSKNSLSSLAPFVDDTGLLRVGGRLTQAPLPYNVRHPLILAPHPVVSLIAAHAHLRALHGGLQLTLNTLRQDYWILRARTLVKSIIHRCLVCVRERASIPNQLMGNLPPVRVSQPPRSFAHCGLDYAGPFKVRASAGRGITSRKSYVALFICLATRAIHVELVSDYSTSAFIAAFTRFCSRRGLPQSVYSDNGTNFIGADKELSYAYRAALRDPNFQSTTASDKIAWHFIPPSAPHFGGMWEAGVRSVKHHLRRVAGDHTLTFEEFTTLLYQIEACLNSRPIAPLSDSIDDFRTLTPGHFLIGSNLLTPPEPSTLHLEDNRLSRWQLVRRLTERFWKIWTSDYINTLQQRNKWRKTTAPISVGRLVLLRNPALPPCKWDLGRIIKIYPGSDGLTRVVSVKTAASEYKRPIGKLCILPIECASDKKL